MASGFKTRWSSDCSPSGKVKATSADTQFSFKDGRRDQRRRRNFIFSSEGNVGRLPWTKRRQAQVKIERAPRSDVEESRTYEVMPEYIEYLQEEYDIVYFSVGAGLLTYSLNEIYESAAF
eukprot:scaffold702_cov220-Chaetoceros_neogracile.AAC.3